MTGASDPNPLPAGRAALPGLLLASLVAIAAWALFLANRAPGTFAALHGFPLDDAWIHLVYARSLATEGGFHYNPGVAETGMTSPLWVVFAASVHLVTAPFGVPAVVLGTKLLSLLFGIGCVWALFALARALGLATWAALLAAFLCAADPALTFSRAAGMEVPLFTMLLLLALGAALKGEIWSASVATGLSLVARPEGALLVPVVAILLVRRARAEIRRPAHAAGAVAAIALPSLLYVAFCQAATGWPFPNTYYLKLDAAGGATWSNLALGWRDYVHAIEPYFTLEAGSVLALLGAAALLRKRGGDAAAVLGAGALLFAGTLASRGFSAGHFHYWERWLVPAYPFLLLTFAAGIEGVASWLQGRVPSLPVARAATAAIVALLVAATPTVLVRRATEYAWNCQNVDEINVALGVWIDRNLPRDAVVAVNDAGALRYFGQRLTVDLLGLNDHGMREALAARRGMAYLEERGVGWLAIFPSWYPGIERAFRLEPIHEVTAPVYTIARARQDRMVLYRWDRSGPPGGGGAPAP